MGRFFLAWRAFWAALTNRQAAERLEASLAGPVLPKVADVEKPKPAPRPEPVRSARSEALTLLAALQREARLVDLIKQPLANYSDEEIGAAARNVLGDAAAAIDRFFQLQPLAKEPEGSSCEVPAGYDPACYKLSGRVEGAGPFRGNLVHHGWKASTVNLPSWTGSNEAAQVVAPAEIEVT
jgi:hypothetical protein